MPLPTPNKGEEKSKFISRCIKTIIDSGEQPNTEKGREIASGICYTQWAKAKGERTRIKDGKVQVLHTLSAEIKIDDSNKSEWNQVFSNFDKWIEAVDLNKKTGEDSLLRLPRSTLIVGDGIYNEVWHPKEELEKSYGSMDRQPYILNHSRDILHEVGWMEIPQYDKQALKMSAIPVINLNTMYGRQSLAHIQNRLMAGKPAETSVGFWCTEATEHVVHEEKEIDEDMLVAREWEFDHNALVDRGACSPADGAGIGLNKNILTGSKGQMEEKMTEKKEEKPSEVTNQEKTIVTNADGNISPVTNTVTKEVMSREEYRKIALEAIEAREKEHKENEMKLQSEKKITDALKLLKDGKHGDAQKILEGLKPEDKSTLTIEEQLANAQKEIDELKRFNAQQFAERTTRTRTSTTDANVQRHEHDIAMGMTGIKWLREATQNGKGQIITNKQNDLGMPPDVFQRFKKEA